MTTLVQTGAKWYERYGRYADYLRSPLLLLLRLYFGWQFMAAGLGKLLHVPDNAALFADWGIPQPTLNVYLAGTTETACGLLLLLGVASRVTVLPLIGTMVVAYATAHREQVFDNVGGDPLGTVTAFAHAPPFAFLVTALLVLAFGPGWWSVDGAVKWYCHRQAHGPGAERLR